MFHTENSSYDGFTLNFMLKMPNNVMKEMLVG